MSKDKIVLKILIKEDQENECAKCCKTIQVIERMTNTITELKEKIDILYKNISSKEIVDIYGKLEVPAVIINNIIYSQGHVPIIKKLSRKLIELLK